MRLVVKEPGLNPEIREVENTIKAFQAILGGDLEATWHTHFYRGFGEDHMLQVFHCKEPRDMRFNLNRPQDGHPVLGPIIAVKVNQKGEDVSMSEKEASFVATNLQLYAEALGAMDGEIGS